MMAGDHAVTFLERGEHERSVGLSLPLAGRPKSSGSNRIVPAVERLTLERDLAFDRDQRGNVPAPLDPQPAQPPRANRPSAASLNARFDTNLIRERWHADLTK